PLMRAAFWNENPAVIQVFLDAGAKVNARDSNDATPLMLAAHRNRNPAVVEVLVDAGADVTNEVWERIQQNKALRGTDVYGRVAELRLE
ncbi:MAG: ankyrin repeat domain-containing protein, partial [Spirochaetia bacterium]